MITLEYPSNGASVSLQTSIQKEFIKNSEKYLSGDLDIRSLREASPLFNDPSIPEKVTFTWRSETGNPTRIEISKKADFSHIFISETALNRFEAYNLESGTVYYWRVTSDTEESEVFSFTTMDLSPRFLFVEGTTTNIRDLGGYLTEEGRRIKQGRIIRGAELDTHMEISENGKKTMCEVLGIKTDLDLREEAIGVTLASPLGEGVKLIQIPLKAYTEYLAPENADNIVKIFEILSDENNYPVYFHCWGGADRTGSLAFTIEALLGLDEERLMLDYELTSICRYENTRRRSFESFAAMVEALRTMGSTWQERMTKFVVSCGVGAEQIKKLKKIMLEDSDR